MTAVTYNYFTRYDDAATSNATINARIYHTLIYSTWVMAAGSNFAFKIAAKLLQIETLLLLTTYRNWSLPFALSNKVLRVFKNINY